MNLEALSTPQRIVAASAEFDVASLIGRVFLKDIATAENGVTVRLELASGGAALTATTTTIGGAAGTFELKNISWTDTKPESPETEQARLYVQDADYVSDNDSESPLIITLAAGTNLDLSASPLEAEMINFSCPKVMGKVRDGANGIGGISVVLDLNSTANDSELIDIRIDGADADTLPDPWLKAVAEGGNAASDASSVNYTILSRDDNNILERGLSVQVRRLAEAVGSGKAELAEKRAKTALQEEQAKNAKVSFENELLTREEASEAEVASIEARLEYLLSRFQLANALIDLEYASGIRLR